MITINSKDYRELRCLNDNCRKLFLYERIKLGKVAWICDRCGTLNERDFNMLKTKDNMSSIEDSLVVKGGEIK